MAHMHDHVRPSDAEPAFRSAAQRSGGRLAFVFALTLAFAAVEIAGGILTDSLALLADAGHMLTDALGLGMALAAVWIAGRPASNARSYGAYRLEILAALFNALLLFGVAGYVLFESARRFADPPDVAAGGMLAVAVAGLAVNAVGLGLLSRGARESMNMRGAYLEVLGDALGSAAAIVAALILLTTGWRYADPLFGAGIGLFILPRTWRLLREALHVLLEGTPAYIDARAVEGAMLALPRVRAVHDLHIWAITSGMEVLSCHVVVDDPDCGQECLTEVGALLRDRFGIDHMTVQIEGPGFDEKGPPF